MLAAQPALYRAIAAEVGPRAPEILTQAVTQVGLPPLSDPAVADLAGVVAETLDEPGVAKVVAGLADQDSKQTADPRPQRWLSSSRVPTPRAGSTRSPSTCWPRPTRPVP